MASIKAVELIISGEVQGVGYRGFVTRIARKLKLVGFAENLEDGTVRIHCKGEAAAIGKFKELIKVKNPPHASLIEVEGIIEKALGPENVTGTGFKEKLGDMGEEMAQGFATGNAYLSSGFAKMGDKIDDLSAETKSGFSKLGDKIDDGFAKMGDKIDSGFDKTDANFGVLADKYGKISNTMEHMDKNIEKMAKKDVFR